jgi:hypothetical protein
MREIDCLSLVFIDFYVPALTPRLDCIKAALQLSENIALLALYCSMRIRIHGNVSAKNIRLSIPAVLNRRADRIVATGKC